MKGNEINVDKKETLIKNWFNMWLLGTCEGIEDIFSRNAVYIESWGPRYEGLPRIKHWFKEWNTRGKVKTWDIKQFFHKEDQTIVEWYFADAMNTGKEEKFDGISLIVWQDGKIAYLKEFGCNIDHYDPYEFGNEPVFRKETSNWF